jgi:hypothetical protein
MWRLYGNVKYIDIHRQCNGIGIDLEFRHLAVSGILNRTGDQFNRLWLRGNTDLSVDGKRNEYHGCNKCHVSGAGRSNDRQLHVLAYGNLWRMLGNIEYHHGGGERGTGINDRNRWINCDIGNAVPESHQRRRTGSEITHKRHRKLSMDLWNNINIGSNERNVYDTEHTHTGNVHILCAGYLYHRLCSSIGAL